MKRRLMKNLAAANRGGKFRNISRGGTGCGVDNHGGHGVFRCSVPFEVWSFDIQSFDFRSNSTFSLSMFGPIRGSVFRCLVLFDVRSFEVRSFDVQSFEVQSFEVRSFEVRSRFPAFTLIRAAGGVYDFQNFEKV